MNKGRNFKRNPVVQGFRLTTRQQDISAPVGPSSAISTKQIVIGAKLSQRTLYHGILSPLVLSIVSVTLLGTKELLLLQDPKPQPCASSPTWPPYNGMNSVVGLPQHGHMWVGWVRSGCRVYQPQVHAQPCAYVHCIQMTHHPSQITKLTSKA